MPISQDKIQEHTNLLKALNALDYVPSASEDNIARLEVIDREIRSREREVEALKEKTKSEHKDLSRAKSITRQWLLRIREGGEAVSQKLEKEQKEYMDALRAERDACDELDMLIGEKTEREHAKLDLAQKMDQITELKAKIEELYEGLFAGPTPEYPEEERAESRLKAVETQYHRTQTYLNKYTTAITLLITADKTIRTCMNKLNETRIATARVTTDNTLENMSQLLIQGTTLLSARLTIPIARSLIRQADEACSGSVRVVVGSLDMIPEAPTTTQWDGEKHVNVLDVQFPAKLDLSLQKLGEARTRLQGEIEKCSKRIDEYQNSVRQLTAKLQNCRKELADIRFRIIMSLTDPAALEARPHSSARNAHEVGDSELPMYFDSANTVSGKPTADPSGNISVGVPSYEESQAQAAAAGGFRVSLPNGNANPGPSPLYAPSGPAPGPGGVGGFRATVEPSRSPNPSLSLQIPADRWSPMPSPQLSSPSAGTPVVSLPPSGLSQPGPSVPRPISWSLNPYASAMIRRASKDDEASSPLGGRADDSNPFRAPREPHTYGH
ncbi:hypothetical protein OPQ81_007016 [Rhizoctonia solani]|nr:hypothetical protein OPQ81_007016 [Rhizoctonia solani]